MFTVKRIALLLALAGALTLPGTARSSTYTFAASDLWDNGYDNVATPRQSTFARLVFTTDAGAITVRGTTTLHDSYPAWAQLGLVIDGVQQAPLHFTANGPRGFSVTLGSAGITRTIGVIAGVESNPAGPGAGTVIGSFIDSVNYPITSFLEVQPPTMAQRILIYGDSITEGANAATPVYQGYAALLRTTYGLHVALESWGYRALNDDAASVEGRDAFVAQLASYSPTVIVLAIGTNDYGLSRWSAPSFGAAYGATLDAIHAVLPAATVVCVTPIVRSNESANSYGSTLSDYRAEIESVCDSRPDYTEWIDGRSILSTSDLDDGVHPTTAGQQKYAAYLGPILSALPAISSIEEESSSTPRLVLDPPFPNPIAVGTTFRFSGPLAEEVELSIYDASGRLVEHLAHAQGDGAAHTLHWSAGKLNGGAYFAVLASGAHRVTRKLIVSR